MKLAPFFTYFGGKYRCAPKLYPAPKHRTLIEPFAGSAGYAVRYPDHNVVLCDKDPVIAGVWRYLIRVSEAEVLALPDLANEQTVADLSCPQEARWLIGFWLTKGTTHPSLRPASWMRHGLRPRSSWGPTVRQRIARQLRYIRHWQVFEGHYTSVGGPTATYFVDPPYRGGRARYRCHDKAIDFAELAVWCRAQRGQVIVCECEGADWLPFQNAVVIKGQRRECRREVVWMADQEATPRVLQWSQLSLALNAVPDQTLRQVRHTA